MEQCLIDNKVCSANNKKCKICKLDSCRGVIQTFEDYQKYKDKEGLIKLKKDLPEQCKNCSFLIIKNLEKEQVYCPYMVKKCILKE